VTSDNICSRTDDFILRHLALSPAPKTTVAKLRQFMEKMLELMKCFDFLSSVMCRMKKQDEETIEIFQKNAKYFGQIYRTYSDKSATPKLHLLEVHAPKELRLHKTFGLFAEDPLRGSVRTTRFTTLNLIRNENQDEKKLKHREIFLNKVYPLL
jgi:hypothetical protein